MRQGTLKDEIQNIFFLYPIFVLKKFWKRKFKHSAFWNVLEYFKDYVTLEVYYLW